MFRRLNLAILAMAVAIEVAGACAPQPAGAASALDCRFGTPELGISARLRGMGGAGGAVGDGALGLIDNPVSPALSRRGDQRRALDLQLSLGYGRASENRFVPLYDTFDSYVTETAIAVNDHGYGRADFGVTLDDPRLGFTIGLSSVEAYDPRYDYGDERRTTATTDQIVAERFIRTRGTLRATSLGVSRELPFALSAGAAVHAYRGAIAYRDALVPRQNGIAGRVEGTRRELSGASLALGVAWRANERLRGAVAWESGPRMKDRHTVTLDDAVIIGPDAERTAYWPPRVHVSAAYWPRNTLRTTFAVDAIWTSWSQITDSEAPELALLDTWDLRFGLEHRYLRQLPGRLGFRYERSPLTREADRVWFTFGAGWQVQRFMLDGAVEIGKRTSRQEPVWTRTEQAGSVGAGLDRVEDTLARITFGVRVGTGP